MSDHTARRIDEMEAYYLGAMKRARAELGVTSFGLQVMDMPPNLELYPEHNHAESGQEEVEAGVMIRVGPAVTRKVWPGEDGMRLIAISGVPGGVYEPPKITELGQPDPMAG